MASFRSYPFFQSWNRSINRSSSHKSLRVARPSSSEYSFLLLIDFRYWYVRILRLLHKTASHTASLQDTHEAHPNVPLYPHLCCQSTCSTFCSGSIGSQRNLSKNVSTPLISFGPSVEAKTSSILLSSPTSSTVLVVVEFECSGPDDGFASDGTNESELENSSLHSAILNISRVNETAKSFTLAKYGQ